LTALSKILRRTPTGRLQFWCPACDDTQDVVLPGMEGNFSGWTWNGDAEKPTFHPSFGASHLKLIKDKNGKWQGEYALDSNNEPIPVYCHSFVTDGRIQFLNDSTHEFKGQTLDLPEWNTHLDDLGSRPPKP